MATEVLVPPLGQTVDTVTLVSWYKGEGETVAQGEMLFAIETDKATLDVEAPASGVLRRVTVQPGEQVPVLSAIALIAAPDEVLESGPADEEQGRIPDRSTVIPGDQPGQKPRMDARRIFISPRARRLAEEHDIPLVVLEATGPEGAIVERDVRAYLDLKRAPAITPVARRVAEAAGLDWRTLNGEGPGGRIMREDVDRALREAERAEGEEFEAIPVSGVRAVIAERMLESATATARVTLNAEADATALVDLRRRLLQDEVEVSYNDLLLSILGRALRDHPQLNASSAEDTIEPSRSSSSLGGDSGAPRTGPRAKENSYTIKLWKRVHVGLAVDTDRGLLVPVMRDVDRKGLRQLARETGPLIERARAGQCTPEELAGGTFTLTNLGMFGIDSFTPIINLPECAVLGVGRIKKQPAVIGDQVAVRRMVWLSLTFDHRLVDGAPAARFLQRVVQLIERPHLLLA